MYVLFPVYPHHPARAWTYTMCSVNVWGVNALNECFPSYMPTPACKEGPLGLVRRERVSTRFVVIGWNLTQRRPMSKLHELSPTVYIFVHLIGTMPTGPGLG